MHKWIAGLILFLTFGIGNPTHAFQVRVINGPVHPEAARRVQAWLDETVQRLPPLFHWKISKDLKVRFTGAYENLSDPCLAGQDLVLGHSNLGSGQIEIHSSLLNEILKGPHHATRFNCGHGSYYRWAQAVLIHELGHFFDQETLYSQAQEFLRLEYWKSHRKNHLLVRSIDPYVSASAQENYLIDLEYFLLDPDFQCRRRSVFQFLKKQLQHDPFPVRACERGDLFLLSTPLHAAGVAPSRLNPKDLYEVHYLLAGPGNRLFSHWGHAMIRLVMCRPERLEKGPACLSEDMAYHIVLSFRAHADLPLGRSRKSKFPSRLYAFPFLDILEEYTEKELRDLMSFPLLLNEEEKQRVLDFALEQHWGYEGGYHLIKNNCATETRDFLLALLGDPSHAELRGCSSLVSPKNLYEELLRTGWIDPAADLGSRAGSFYPSKKARTHTVFIDLQEFSSFFRERHFDKFVFVWKPAQRRILFQNLTASLEKRRKDQERIAASFYVLENHIRQVKGHIIQKEILKDEVGEGLQEISYEAIPWHLLPMGYGVPLRSEIEEILLPSLQKIENVRGAQLERLAAELRRRFLPLFEELDGIDENVRYFLHALISVRK